MVMKSTAAAAAVLALALAATTASAGVVISQERVVHSQSGDRKSDQTLMVQGHKERLVLGDRAFITDLDAGKIYLLNSKAKQFAEAKFPPTGVLAAMFVREGLSVGFKNAGTSKKIAGYDCQDYVGTAPYAWTSVNVAECVAAGAPGAKEFVEFLKARAEKLKGSRLEAKGDIPDGIPVASLTTFTPATFPGRPGMDPKQVKQVQDELAKHKPVVTAVTVSKIEVKDLPADTFTVPADYKEQQVETPNLPKMHGAMPVTPPAAPDTH